MVHHGARPDILTLSSPALPVSSTSNSHRQSNSPFPQSPFHFAHFPTELSEKPTNLDLPLERVPSLSLSRHPIPPQHPPSRPQTPTTPSIPSPKRTSYIHARLKPWIPIILYVMTSLVFVVAIAFFKTELFTLLDNLAVWLRRDEQLGAAVLFSLIFITTFPPVPMYSTLIMLAGYTYGAFLGAVISYFAALVGAIVVFIISRTLLREWITRWLDSACTIKRVVRAVEKRPRLLFLVRLAPYPYNVMNCLLAASPTLTFKTYTLCTAASLFKVIIHTTLGASIHSFKDYHSSEGIQEEDGSANTVARISTIVGVILCVAIFVYLSVVVRRAVDDELGDDDVGDSEETAGFLANADEESGARPMVELRR
ncbi:hypothetical protein MKEN_00075300 [Mycena kentingensis (nom. inval.)]|nr:hypothetical protein MKEN_00075300 [Mycena kentingensis (nom. inval.)]